MNFEILVQVPTGIYWNISSYWMVVDQQYICYIIILYVHEQDSRINVMKLNEQLYQEMYLLFKSNLTHAVQGPYYYNKPSQ